MNDASGYAAFLARKTAAAADLGRPVADAEINPTLHAWQREITAWAVRTGRAAIWADTGLGKALDSDTLVATPANGMQRIGALHPGDFVIGADGQPTEVLGVFPQGTRNAYRVTFSDDASIVCDDEHLWNVRTKTQKHRGRDWQTLTLREIRTQGIGSPGAARVDRWFIPMVEPVQFHEPELPMHPYMLGCLIGDGYIKRRTPCISSADEELIERLRDIAPLGIEIQKVRYSKYDYAIISSSRNAHAENPVVTALTELGVQGHGAESKFIPDAYKFASADTRILLLQGLMDTDGSVWDSHGSPVLEYCTVSPQLARDFQFLVQSLGGKGRIRTKKTSGLLAYRITPAFPVGINPFLLKRKADRFKPRTKYLPARSIRSIDPVGERDMTCIRVAAADGLFVADGFIVTHNTRMQLEWARLSAGPDELALIVAPLAVCQQTAREAAAIGIDARYVRSQDQITHSGTWIANYEMAERFDPSQLAAVVLDEASILKNSDGKTRAMLIRHFQDVPARLACTATPAPNDPEELTSQAEFLGRSTRANMLAAYFVHDSDGWRLKGHARTPMFQWMASWALAVRRPSDLGYPDGAYELPGLDIIPHLLDVDTVPEGQLFATDLGGIGGRAAVRRETLKARCEQAARLVEAEPDDPWLLWTGMNDEADTLAKMIPGAVNVHGSMTPERKADELLAFADGKTRCLITKPSIAGMGLNLQVCARMAFVGLSDSYEQYYQAIRRCHRYGQTRRVHAHIVLSRLEAQIASNVARKETEAAAITGELVAQMQRHRATTTEGTL